MFPRLVADLPAVLGDLLAWGRDTDGWWGLVVWEHRVMDAKANRWGGYVRYSAWMPASTLHPSRYESVAVQYDKIVRLDLPKNRAMGPSPAQRLGVDTVHYGAVTTPARVRLT